MKIAITGAFGLLGSEMVRTLGEAHEVIPFPPHAELDLADFSAVRRFVDSARPEAIVHCAGFRDLDPCELDPQLGWHNNAVATFSVANAAREFGCVVVHASSDSVFAGERQEPYHEFDLTGPPVSVYGRTKLAAENIIRESLQRYFVLRLPWLFGRSGGPQKNWIVQSFQKVKAGQTVSAASDQLANVLYTVDVALVVARMLETESWGVYNLASPGSVTRSQAQKAALAAAGVDPGCVQEISIADLSRPAKRTRCVLLTSLLLEPVFGLRIPAWQERMVECAGYLKADGWLS